jgi:O-acetylhomoserine (thiol)-lyase
VQQFTNTIRKFGWSAKFVDFDDLARWRRRFDENTRAIFCESIANPGGYVTDLPAVAKVADKAGLPLIVDNTSATPYLCRPIEHGATLVVHSTTKYLTGNGTVTGGCRRRFGQVRLVGQRQVPVAVDPEPAYHGLKFHEPSARWPLPSTASPSACAIWA